MCGGEQPTCKQQQQHSSRMSGAMRVFVCRSERRRPLLSAAFNFCAASRLSPRIGDANVTTIARNYLRTRIGAAPMTTIRSDGDFGRFGSSRVFGQLAADAALRQAVCACGDGRSARLCAPQSVVALFARPLACAQSRLLSSNGRPPKYVGGVVSVSLRPHCG